MSKARQPSQQNRRRSFFRRPGYRPRTSLAFVPLACLFAAWLLNNIEPTIDWDDVLSFLGVADHDGYARLMVLGLVLVGILVVIRVYRDDRR